MTAVCCLVSHSNSTPTLLSYHCTFFSIPLIVYPTSGMPKVQSKGSKRSSAAAKKACAICMNHFRPQAFAAHVRKCEREKREEEELLEYKKEVIGKAQAQLAGMWYSALFLFLVHFSFTFCHGTRSGLLLYGDDPLVRRNVSWTSSISQHVVQYHMPMWHDSFLGQR